VRSHPADITAGASQEAEVELGAAVLADHPLPRHGDGDTKRDRGTVLVVGGSAQTPGSVVLAGTSALRAGAGRLQIATSGATAAAVGTAVPEARVIPWDEAPDSDGRDGDLALAMERADAVLLGTGMLDDVRAERLLGIAAAALGPETRLLVDSAALSACGDGSLLRPLADRVALMPNGGEAARMLDDDAEGGADPAEAIRRLVELHGITVALRNATTFISSPSERGTRWVERSGGPALATSGSGDVLAGVTVGLLGRGADPLTALLWAVHAHARAGGWGGPGIGLLARDLLDRVAPALADIGREVG
jgi:hydroxyethylthiazole kinase-like uncharacterized protein yjeF